MPRFKQKSGGVRVQFTQAEEDARDAEEAAAALPPTSAELDALADAVAENSLENDLHTKAMGMVMADLVEQVFGVSQAVARQQVKTRFRNYYRGLL